MRNKYNVLKKSAVWAVAFLLVIALFTPALAAKPGGGATVSHKAKQLLPIQLGTSGGWRYDLANGYCCGGTLGSLVKISGVKYILSNFHVFAADVVLGGNNRAATKGDPIIQPGLIDVSCNAANAQDVASLDQWRNPLDGYNVDAAIAWTDPTKVKDDGSILEIGTISNATLAPKLNLPVKKSGRTTGLTRSTITGLNATVNVTYDTECAGTSRGTAKFTGQIMIANRSSKFLAAGDSGSLMVEDVATSPRAVGLLFAGSSSVAVANPIGEVLASFNASMVGVGTGTMSTEIPDANVENAKKAQAKHDLRLKRVPGGVGHGVGIGRTGRVVIKVYVEKDTPEARAAAPDSVDGIPVEIEETGKIIPFSSCR